MESFNKGTSSRSSVRRRFRPAAGFNGNTVLNRFRAPDWTLGDDEEAKDVTFQLPANQQRRRKGNARSRRDKRQTAPSASFPTLAPAVPVLDEAEQDNRNSGRVTLSAIDPRSALPRSSESSQVFLVPTRAQLIEQPSVSPRASLPFPYPSPYPSHTNNIAIKGFSTALNPEPTSGIPPEFQTGTPGDLISESDSGDSDSDSDHDDDDDSGDDGDEPASTIDNSSAGITSASLSFPTETSTSLPEAAADAAEAAKQRHHEEVETALIAVGAVVGAVCIGLGFWWLYRYQKRRRNSYLSPSDLPDDTRQPWRPLHFLTRVPFFGTRFAQHPWVSIDDTLTGANFKDEAYRDAKPISMTGTDLLGLLPDGPTTLAAPHPPPPAAMAPTRQRDFTDADEKRPYVFPNTAAMNEGLGIDRGAAWSPTESSLSSAFGNGTYMPPTPPGLYPLPPPPPAPAQVPQSPAPTLNRRDTSYTEASSVPRFKTVHSWVKQQTARVRKSSGAEGGVTERDSVSSRKES